MHILRVLHVDDDRDHHELTKEQLRSLSDDVELVRVGSCADAAVSLKDELYSCILVDDQLPGNDYLRFLQTLREDRNLIPFIVLSETGLEDEQGFELHAYAEDEFNVRVSFGRFAVLNHWIHHLVDQYARFLQSERLKMDLYQSSPDKIRELEEAYRTLTRREIEILNHIATGDSNKEIADKLFISYRTVVNHVYNIFGKLDIHTRAEAIHLALSMKLTEKQDDSTLR